MPIQYEQKPGTILRCDYGKGGFRAPEMVKARPVVVVSKRKRKPTGLLTVVPLSITPPAPIEAHHCRIVLERPLPGFPQLECWAKVDMVGTVAMERLDLFRTDRGPGGQRKYLSFRISDTDLDAIRVCLQALFGF